MRDMDDIMMKAMGSGHPPVEDPSEHPKHPPVEEPGRTPDEPPPPNRPPVGDPGRQPRRPPVEEPPPEEPAHQVHHRDSRRRPVY